MNPVNRIAKCVPSPLDRLRVWVDWQKVNGTKVPFVCGTQHRDYASSTNPETWRTFDEAIEFSPVMNSDEGIGYVLGGDTQKEKILAIDIDGCRNRETDQIAPWADEIIDAMDSYTEITPSGDGVRILVRGEFPSDRHVFKLDPAAGFGDKVQVEVFERAKYFTFTGDSIYEEPAEIETRDLGVLYQLLGDIQKQHPVKSADKKTDNGKPATSSAQIESSGTAITNKCELLMHGTVSGDEPFVVSDDQGHSIQYPSASEADMALCNLSALKHGDNPDAIWADYTSSALVREKWTQREQWFRENTIKKAIGWAKIASTVEKEAELQLPQPWSDPRPLRFDLPAVMPFSEEFLPKSLRPLVRDTSERMSVPMDFPAIVAISALAGAVGRRAFVYPKRADKSWKEALNLWGAIVERPGMLKTPTINTVCRPVNDIEKDWQKKYKKEYKDFADRKDAHKAWKDRERKRKQPDANDVEPQVGDPPNQQRLVVNDSTPEKLHTVMSENPRGVLVLRDELSGWLDELDQKGREAQRALFLEAWNGDQDYCMDRINRGSVTARMNLSMVGSFQPGLLQDYLERRNRKDGLFQRFQLFVWPDPCKWQNIDRSVDSKAVDRAYHIYKVVAEQPAESSKFHFDPDAQELFNAWIDKHMKVVEAEIFEDRQAHLSKYRGLMPTLAALFQLADIAVEAEETGLGFGPRFIDAEHTQQAIAFCSYLQSHLDRIYGAIRPSFIRIASTILNLIRTEKLRSGFTVREIQRAGHFSAEDVKAACEELIELGWIREYLHKPEGEQGGRPTLKYQIHPEALKFLGA